MSNILLIGLGGGIGAILRYLLSLISFSNKGGFPVATFLTNILGAFLIGVIVGFAIHGKKPDERLVLFLKTGVCGGFTTFSTFALESSNLLSSGKLLMGILYMCLSVTFCVLAVMAGEAISRTIAG